MNPEQIMLGKYSLPFILSIILSAIYRRTNIKNDIKPYIAVVIGIVVAIFSMFYQNPYVDINFVMVSDYAMAGMMGGLSAVGIYEANKESPVGRTYVALDKNNKRIPDAKVVKFSKTKVVG